MLTVSNALRRRATTAALLIPLTVTVVLWSPTSIFGLYFAAFVLLGAWEWTGLAGLARIPARVGYLVTIGAALLGLWFVPPGPWSLWLLAGAALWWWWLALTLPRIQTVTPTAGLSARLLLTGLIVLVGPWVAMVHLHGALPAGPLLLLFLLVLIWVADSAAYFSGRRWGKAKLAPALSPGKTWAGVHGALIGAALCGAALGLALELDWHETLLAILICGLTVAISIVGDLYESLLKRRRGLKDSGRLLPGHGGVLDRIDSLTSAAPIFTLGVILTGIGR
ncbi:phosphatidate cytidylyltransferase [Thioalkalicoccus limnaeus]|uniref:Phosphatidate cytidylyltransferase n=1 Tax=Thioalkalicoccus limnaeus TaxID=120681 RepID=A0ABV4BBJ5_9GAMM